MGPSKGVEADPGPPEEDDEEDEGMRGPEGGPLEGTGLEWSEPPRGEWYPERDSTFTPQTDSSGFLRNTLCFQVRQSEAARCSLSCQEMTQTTLTRFNMFRSRALLPDTFFSTVERLGFQPVSMHVLSNVAVCWLKLHICLMDVMGVIQMVSTNSDIY